MLNTLTTTDIKNELVRKYKKGDFRLLYNGTVKTVEIQNAHFICDKDWIIREPNYDYAEREIEWYKSQSLYVEDIPGKTPKIWEDCADIDGMINSNYGWCIWSNENGNQYKNCLRTLIKDPYSRQACMLYTRPNMQTDATKNGKHDFMCTYAVQCFLNHTTNEAGVMGFELKYIVYMRSNDAVFGFDNDVLWHKYVANKLANDLETKFSEQNNGLTTYVIVAPIEWNAGSLHVYERHFKFLEEPEIDMKFVGKVKEWCISRGLSEDAYYDIIKHEVVDKYAYPHYNLTRQQVLDIKTGVLQQSLNN